MPRSRADSSDSSAASDSSGNDFAIVCSCGQPHSGQRRRRHQQILCKECGTALFVLPLDVYPKPSAGGKKKRRKKGGRLPVGDWLKSFAGSLFPKLSSTAASARSSASRLARFLFAPWKLAVYAVLFAVMGTGWYVRHRSQIAEAKVTVVADAEAGMSALKSADYEVASERLQAAADAVRLLGRSDEASRRIEQSAREATVLANLASSPLLDLLGEVEEAGVDANDEWKRPQQLGMRGQWLAFDATVEKRDEKIAVVLPIHVGNPPSPIFVRVDSDLFQSLPLKDEPRTLVFAGQVENVRRLDNAWDVTLDPDSIFLWESLDLYPELGFVIDPIWNTTESVAERLSLQRTWQGGEELPGDFSIVTDGEGDQAVEVDGDSER